MPTRIITALLLCFATSLALAEPPALLEDAPERHVVVPGDTLWGIASKFLKEPWRWVDLWKQNRNEIKSPHHIYPGQVIILDKSGSVAELKLGQMLSKGVANDVEKIAPRIYEDQQIEAIPTIPPQAIQPFLSEPRIVEAGDLDKAPRILATEEGRVLLGPGHLAYVVGIETEDKLWQAYRPAKPLTDPETGAVLGFEAFYLGSLQVARSAEAPTEAEDAKRGVLSSTLKKGIAAISERLGNAEPQNGMPVTTLEVITAKREMGIGDRLVAASRPDVVSYPPHSPSFPLEGRIASLYDGVGEAGPHSIVTINRGKVQGVEVGHVLALYRRGKNMRVKDGEDAGKVYHLPDERIGLLMVFSVYERISYALVMNSRRPVAINDIVRKP